MNHVQELERLGACSDAVQWSGSYPTLQAAWDVCERGDWMLWLLGRTCGGTRSASRRKLVLAACQCARIALPHVRAGETRPLVAIETAERWARGEGGVTLTMVRNAAYAAAVSAVSADAVSADAAYAAYAAAAYAAADAAYADAAYAAAAYAAAARADTLRRCAEIVQEMYPTAPRLR